MSSIEKGDILYLAGQMTGKPNYNYDKFHTKANELRESGYVIYNPAESLGGDQDQSKSWYLSHDIVTIVNVCDGMALLDDWVNSKGATLEVHVADSISMPIVMADNPDIEVNLNWMQLTYTENHTDIKGCRQTEVNLNESK